MNAEISAYSSGDLPKYEYLTKKDLGYKQFYKHLNKQSLNIRH